MKFKKVLINGFLISMLTSTAFADAVFTCPNNTAFSSIQSGNTSHWHLNDGMRFHSDLVRIEINTNNVDPIVGEQVLENSPLIVEAVPLNNPSNIRVLCHYTSTKNNWITAYPAIALILGDQEMLSMPAKWRSGMCKTTAGNPEACSIVIL